MCAGDRSENLACANLTLLLNYIPGPIIYLTSLFSENTVESVYMRAGEIAQPSACTGFTEDPSLVPSTNNRKLTPAWSYGSKDLVLKCSVLQGHLKMPIWWYQPARLSGHCESRDHLNCAFSQDSTWRAAPTQGKNSALKSQVQYSHQKCTCLGLERWLSG